MLPCFYIYFDTNKSIYKHLINSTENIKNFIIKDILSSNVAYNQNLPVQLYAIPVFTCFETEKWPCYFIFNCDSCRTCDCTLHGAFIMRQFKLNVYVSQNFYFLLIQQKLISLKFFRQPYPAVNAQKHIDMFVSVGIYYSTSKLVRLKSKSC